MERGFLRDDYVNFFRFKGVSKVFDMLKFHCLFVKKQCVYLQIKPLFIITLL